MVTKILEREDMAKHFLANCTKPEKPKEWSKDF